MRVLRLFLTLLVGAVVLPVALVAPAAPAAAAPYCGIWWGSLARSAPVMSGATLTNVRTGRHACYDRLVIDVRGDVRGYDVRYVSQVSQEGSGAPVSLRGGARLAVVARIPAYDDHGRATYRPAHRRELADVAAYRTFRQVAWAGSFEGQTTIGLGVRARLPFRVFLLDGPTATTSRLVVDVAHRW